MYHTVLMVNDDNHLEICGGIRLGALQMGDFSFPKLMEGETYTQVSCGDGHTVVLTSKGRVVACGNNEFGQCSIPSLPGADTHFAPAWSPEVVICQINFDDDEAVCRNLHGDIVKQWIVWNLDTRVQHSVEQMYDGQMAGQKLCVVLPDGQLVNAKESWNQLKNKLGSLR